jgi:hypothetical protein
MPHDLDVAPEIADPLSPEDLDQLAREAAVSYDCWVCLQPGKLPETPASVIILRDGPVDIAKLTHRFCAQSGLIEAPGLTAVMFDPSATKQTRRHLTDDDGP